MRSMNRSDDPKVGQSILVLRETPATADPTSSSFSSSYCSRRSYTLDSIKDVFFFNAIVSEWREMVDIISIIRDFSILILRLENRTDKVGEQSSVS